MTFKKIGLYYNTLKHLRRRQISCRLWYFLRNRWRKLSGFKYDFEKTGPLSIKLFLEPSIAAPTSFSKENGFTLLNLTQKFIENIDWEFADFGKLWTYNLTYFDFLNQNTVDTEGSSDVRFGMSNVSSTTSEIKNQIAEIKIKFNFAPIIDDFIEKLPTLKNALEPFPIALRGINWVKFFAQNNIQNPIYDRSLFHQYQILNDNIEYHLLGNHLLENGFSMLFGAVYFQNKDFWQTANKILTEELEEQILADGAHFELCPMYHKIMLFRTLDCYNLLKNNNLQIKNIPSVFDTQNVVLTKLLADKAAKMLGWLENMTYADGTTPNFGDSTEGIAPTSAELFDYAERLKIQPLPHPLSDSGFRKLKNQNFEITAKVGKIGPDYIPGHAHADSLSFELRIKDQPIFVDMGISTYETNARRQLERSTSSHNTVEIAGKNSSEVWGSFRVGKRANGKILKDTPTHLIAQHDGYKNLNINHLREFQLEENTVKITDKTNNNTTSKAYFYASPTLSLQLDNNSVTFKNGKIDFFINEKDNALIEKVELAAYSLPPQYNTFLTAQKVVVTFKGTLYTHIQAI